MFKILQDITNDNNLYLHIRRKIVTFSQQAKNTTNHITRNTDDFITSNDQVQTKRPVQHKEKQTLSPGTKRKLDAIIDDYSDIFSQKLI